MSREELTPESEVIVYRGGEMPAVFKAGEIPELRELFGIPDPSAVPPAPTPALLPATDDPPTATNETSFEIAMPSPSSSSEETQTVNRGPPPPPPVTEPALVPPAEVPPARNMAGLWVAGFMMLLLVIALASRERRTLEPTAPPATSFNDMGAGSGTDLTAEAEGGPASVTPGEIASSVTRYLVRETNVRAQPTGTSAAITMLGRGDSVFGVFVAGSDPRYRWLKITSGPHAGYFVAESNLSASARPQLDTSMAGQLAIAQRTTIYAEPSTASMIVDTVGPGIRVSVIGITSNGFAEIAMRSGRVAYVSVEAFDPGGSNVNPAPVSGPTQPYRAPPTPSDSDFSSAPATPARARRARLQSTRWISGDDYPPAALSSGAAGTVSFSATIGPDGRPQDCRVTGSSGNSALDNQTCRLFQRRARFQPAVDSEGKAVSDTYDGRITWRLN